ncbi:hypothetical protein [Nafulsella turpanensis]|uniref:hypothetical protein n=1 Tax=Nafulsella turpanensis TaxID=1265690 RepID=UPI00034D4F6A|nr:hypothetical protein [Nafulsella turpanensis]
MNIFIYSFVLLLGASIPLQAQLVQPERLELELEEYDPYYSVVSAGGQGILLYRLNEEESRGNDQVFDILHYDTDLKERWSTKLEVEDAELTGHEYKEGKMYLLFREQENQADNYQVYSVDVESGKISGYTIDNAIPVELTEFTTVDGVVLLGGYVNFRPTIIYFDLENDKYRVLPGFYMNKSDLLEIQTDEVTNTFTVLYTEKAGKRQQTISSKTFGRNGELLFEYSLKPEKGKSLQFGRTTSIGPEALYVAGTYSHGNSKYSRGIFIAKQHANGKQEINYYNYGDLDNFFNYMRAGREKRVRKRIERRKIQGKKVKLNYRLLVHNIIEKDSMNILVGEAFYPKFHNGSSFSFYNTSRNRSGIDKGNLEGYRYTHAVLIGFDDKGELLWDNSFEIKDVLSPTLEKFVHVLPQDTSTALLYMFENVLRSKIIRQGEVLEGKNKEDIVTLYEGDEVKHNEYNVGGLEEWYGPYFFAYGVQRIKNSANSSVDANRKVFYINKISYEPQQKAPGAARVEVEDE